MLHVFLPPHNTPADCSPYAAWRLASGVSGSPAQQGQPAGAAVTAVLAVAWQHSVSVYRTVLHQRRPQQQPVTAGGAQQQAPPQPLPTPALLRSWSVAPPAGAASSTAGGSSGSLSSAGDGGVSSAEASGVCGCYFLDSGPLVGCCCCCCPLCWAGRHLR